MTVNPKAKGNRGETIIRDKLRELTGLAFERIPASGALPFLKGDLFIPNTSCAFCIECKNYEESSINDTLLSNKSNKILEWWPKALQDAKVSKQDALLIVKYNRSKLFVITDIKPVFSKNFMSLQSKFLEKQLYIMILDEWIVSEKVSFIK